MATQVLQHKWQRINENGKLTYIGTLQVVFDRDGDPSGWTHKAAEEAVQAEGYTLASNPPDGATCPLRSYRTGRHPKAKQVWICTVTYKSHSNKLNEQASNYEQVEIQGGTKTVTEYYDASDNALDDSDGKHGVPKLVPTKVYRVHRVHSASKNGTWELKACHTNDASAVTTPGGVTLVAAGKAGRLLFLYATERQIAAAKWEVVYVYVEDLGRYRAGGDWVDLLHQEPVATVDKVTGRVTAVSLKQIYDQTTIGSVMGDE